MSQVDQIISDARAFAGKTLDSANSALGEAVRAVNEAPTFSPSNYDYTPTDLSLDVIPELEDFNAGYTNQLNLPDAPSYLSFLPTNIHIPTAPSLNLTIDQIDRPIFDVAKFDGVIPTIPLIELPADPDLILKAAPIIKDIDLGDLDEVVPAEFNAEFNEVAPEYNADLADEYAGGYEKSLPVIQNFIDNQMDAWAVKNAPNYHANRDLLENKIMHDMVDGKAMGEGFETALYNRARARVERERDRGEHDLNGSHSKRGFTLPPGSVSAGRNKLHQASADAIATQATELSIERAKYEIQHKQFVMQLSQDLHKHVQGMALQYAGILLTINQQALDSAKEVAAMVAKNYELLLNRYTEVAKVYAIQVSVYEIELKASLSKVEVFKARAQAAKIAADVDATKLTVYDKELQFELTKVDIYKAKLAGINAKVAISKQQIDAYGVQAQAYVSTVKGKEAEFSAYSAAIRGEESKVKVEVLKVDAFKAEVDGALAQASVDKTRASIVTEFNKAEAAVHQSKVSAFTANANAEASRLSSESNAFRAKADGHRARADVTVANSRARISNEELKLKAITADWQVSSSENISAGELAVKRATSIAQIGVSAGNSFASMASSAMSSQNTMTSLSEQV